MKVTNEVALARVCGLSGPPPPKENILTTDVTDITDREFHEQQIVDTIRVIRVICGSPSLFLAAGTADSIMRQ